MNKSRDLSIEEQIDAYVKGHLSQQEVDQLWVQLLKKPEYIPLLQTEIDVAKVYRNKEKQKSTTHNYWKWIAAAAAVALLIISINFFGHNSQKKSIQEWAQGQINVATNLSTAPVTRSEAHVTSPDSLLNAGFKAAVDGKIDQAMHIYKNILTRYNAPPLLSKAYLNLGILLYNTEKFNKSIENFDAAIKMAKAKDEAPLMERAYWYMGNAYIHAGQLDRARAAVQQAYSYGQLYKSEASKLLKRLD